MVIVSDFPRGHIDSIDVRAIPPDVSVTLHRIPVVSTPVAENHWKAGNRRITVRASLRDDYTDAEWGGAATNDSTRIEAVTFLGAESDQAAINATRIAAATSAVALPVDSSRAVAIVFPGYSNRRALDTATQSAYAPWMVDLLRRASAHGNDVQRSAVEVAGNRRRLVLVTDSAPGSMASVRIAAAAAFALSPVPPFAELQQETLSEREVASLERPARSTSGSRPGDPNGESDAPWLWAVVFLLLLIELPLRRSTRSVAPAGEERARAA